MIGDYFYHGTLKNAIKLFGKLFSNLQIKKGSTLYTVPVSYAKKDKIIQKYNQYLAGDQSDELSITLPRIGFIMGDPQFNSTRHLNRLNKIHPLRSKARKTYSFNSVPYDVPFYLSIMAKNYDEILQLIEQIMPFFTPEFVVSLEDVPRLELTTDYVFKLDSLSEELDTFDGSFDDRRLIVQTLQFTCELNLYYPVLDSKQIKKILLTGISGFDHDETMFDYDLEVVPLTAQPTDVHVLKEIWDEKDGHVLSRFTAESYEVFISNINSIVMSDYSDSEKYQTIWTLIQDMLGVISEDKFLYSQICSKLSQKLNSNYLTSDRQELLGVVPMQPMQIYGDRAPHRYECIFRLAQ